MPKINTPNSGINKPNLEAVKGHDWENTKQLTPTDWKKLQEEARRMRVRLLEAGHIKPD